jgi:hypothetical protein
MRKLLKLRITRHYSALPALGQSCYKSVSIRDRKARFDPRRLKDQLPIRHDLLNGQLLND